MSWFRYAGILLALGLCLTDWPLASINVAMIVAVFQLEAINSKLEKNNG